MKPKLHRVVVMAVMATIRVCPMSAATLYVALNAPNPTPAIVGNSAFDGGGVSWLSAL